MQNNWQSSLARVLVYEGGKVDNPKDPGGRTNQGVTQTTFTSYLREKALPSADVYLITSGEVSDIYKTRYWDVVQGDALPAGVDFCLFDPAVNSGPAHAVVWLQQSLGDVYKGSIDGVMGSKTLQAVTDFGDMPALIQALCSHRLGTLEKLSTWKTFGKGWSARIASVQKAACAMAAGDAVPSPVDVTSLGGHTRAPIIIPQSKTTRIVANTTAVVTGTGAAATQVAAQLTPIQTQFPNWHWLQAIIGGMTAAGGIVAILNHLADSAKRLAATGARRSTVDIDADANLPQVSVMSVQS